MDNLDHTRLKFQMAQTGKANGKATKVIPVSDQPRLQFQILIKF